MIVFDDILAIVIIGTITIFIIYSFIRNHLSTFIKEKEKRITLLKRAGNEEAATILNKAYGREIYRMNLKEFRGREGQF